MNIKRIRTSYGDTVEQFAERLCVLPQTVEGWEKGIKPQATAKALLRYAMHYSLAMKVDIEPEFESMPIGRQILTLMNNFGDKTQKQFADRIHIPDWNITQWLKNGSLSNHAQRYIYEVAIHPERFTTKPKSFVWTSNK